MMIHGRVRFHLKLLLNKSVFLLILVVNSMFKVLNRVCRLVFGFVPGQLHFLGQDRHADAELDGVQEMQYCWCRIRPRLLRG